MFTFPALLWILPLAGLLVVLIHLINMFRYRHVDWGALEFLLAGYKKSRTKVLLKQILLIILRTLAVLLIIILLARPNFDSLFTRFFQGTQTTHSVVLLDDTYSMTDQTTGSQLFDEAVQAVETVLDHAVQVDPGKDLWSLLRLSKSGTEKKSAVFDDSKRQLSLDQGESVRTFLKQVNASESAKNPLIGFQKIYSFLTGEKTADKTVVYFVSDFRRKDWQTSDELTAIVRDLEKEGISVKMVQVGGDVRPNLAIQDVKLLPGIHAADIPIQWEATLINLGSENIENVSLRISVDGRTYPAQNFEGLAPGTSKTQRFSLRIPDSGTHQVRFQLPPDAVLTDNLHFQTLELPQDVKVLVVSSDTGDKSPLLPVAPSVSKFSPNENRLNEHLNYQRSSIKQTSVVKSANSSAKNSLALMQSDNSADVADAVDSANITDSVDVADTEDSVDPTVPDSNSFGQDNPWNEDETAAEYSETVYAQKSLVPGMRTGISVETVSPRYLNREPLDSFDVIYLLDVPTLDPSGISALEKYVAGGGGLCFFLGPKTDLYFASNQLYADGKGLLPIPLKGVADLTKEFYHKRADLVVSGHPMFRLFELQPALLNTVTFEKYLAADLTRWKESSQVVDLTQLQNATAEEKQALELVLSHLISEETENLSPSEQNSSAAQPSAADNSSDKTGSPATAGNSTANSATANNSASDSSNNNTADNNTVENNTVENRAVGSSSETAGANADQKGNEKEKVYVWATLRNGSPLVLEKRQGTGKSLSFLTTLSPQWNNWATNMSFVVMMQELTAYLARKHSEGRELTVESPLTLLVDKRIYREDIEIVAPLISESIPQRSGSAGFNSGSNSDSNSSIQETDSLGIAPVNSSDLSANGASDSSELPAVAQRFQVVPMPVELTKNDNELLGIWNETNLSGFYSLKLKSSASTAEETQLYAVNVDPSEGALAVMDSKELLDLFKGTKVTVENEKKLSFQFDYSFSNWSSVVLWILLALILVGEMMLAGSLLKRSKQSV